jgi:hypothetical protein
MFVHLESMILMLSSARITEKYQRNFTLRCDLSCFLELFQVILEKIWRK